MLERGDQHSVKHLDFRRRDVMGGETPVSDADACISSAGDDLGLPARVGRVILH